MSRGWHVMHVLSSSVQEASVRSQLVGSLQALYALQPFCMPADPDLPSPLPLPPAPPLQPCPLPRSCRSWALASWPPTTPRPTCARRASPTCRPSSRCRRAGPTQVRTVGAGQGGAECGGVERQQWPAKSAMRCLLAALSACLPPCCFPLHRPPTPHTPAHPTHPSHAPSTRRGPAEERRDPDDDHHHRR